MSVYFSLTSIILGLVAIIVPVAVMSGASKAGGKKVGFMPLVGSLTACSLAVTVQMFEVRHRVAIQDWSALMDTIGALSNICVALIVVVTLLNVLATAVLKEQDSL